jgi:large subunit ribosomal protein L25
MSIQLKVARRAGLGTKAARKLRAQGSLPATLQAEGDKPHLDLVVDEVAFLAARRKHEHLYELDLDGRIETALVRTLNWDVFGERILNIEFRRVDRTKRTRVEVDLEFVGHPKGGVLNHLMTHLTVETTPDNIPNSLEVSIQDLPLGAQVVAKDVKLPAGVTLVTASETAIARIVAVKIIEAAPAPAAAEAAPAAGAAAAPAAPGAAPAAAGATPAGGKAPAAGPAKEDKGGGKEARK